MSRRRILGIVLLLAGVAVFVLTWRSIAWMVDGGARDFVQLGLLGLGLGVAGRGLCLLGPEAAADRRARATNAG